LGFLTGQFTSYHLFLRLDSSSTLGIFPVMARDDNSENVCRSSGVLFQPENWQPLFPLRELPEKSGQLCRANNL